MIIQCPKCGSSVAVRGIGRPRLNIPVKKVYDTLQACSSVTLAAQELGCSRGFIYKILKDHGLSAKDIISKT
jgi:transcriptional regulator of acetoin/glycerol metabolism